jgi:hypothetical protein
MCGFEALTDVVFCFDMTIRGFGAIFPQPKKKKKTMLFTPAGADDAKL